MSLIVAVCASDGRSYPSTCHLIAESRQMMVPRVMHTGRCRQMNGMGAMVRGLNVYMHWMNDWNLATNSGWQSYLQLGLRAEGNITTPLPDRPISHLIAFGASGKYSF